jgi:predicted MPP superfamily phosphohydrolase
MNPKWYAIPTPQEGRRFAIGDIHGCNLTLQALVKEQLQLTKQDQLFLLGDYVNRGPDSMGVLNFIMGLQAEGYQVFALRGNHEQMLLDKIGMRDKLSKDTVLMGYTSLARSLALLFRAKPFLFGAWGYRYKRYKSFGGIQIYAVGT